MIHEIDRMFGAGQCRVAINGTGGVGELAFTSQLLSALPHYDPS